MKRPRENGGASTSDGGSEVADGPAEDDMSPAQAEPPKSFIGPQLPPAAAAALAAAAAQDAAAGHAHDSFRERAKYIPLRLGLEERRYLRLLEAALSVSEYTGQPLFWCFKFFWYQLLLFSCFTAWAQLEWSRSL
jgi:hypothetical protein